MTIESGQNTYDRFPEESELISRYNPKFLNRGGEHLVYLVEGHPNVVIKVSTYKIKDSIIDAVSESYKTDSDLESRAQKLYSDEVKMKNIEFAKLRGIFGSEHVLREKRFLMSVPINYKLMQEIFEGDYLKRKLPKTAESIKQVWTHVVVQERTSIAEDEGRYSFNYGSFVEDSFVDYGKYHQVTSILLGDKSSEFKEEDFLSLQDRSKNRSLCNILELAKNNDSAMEQLRNFILKTIKYTEETGQILALAGDDNVLFYTEDGVCNFLLMDAMPNSSEPIFKKFLDLGVKISSGNQLSAEDREYLKRAVNFARVINGVSMSLGFSERLRLPGFFSEIDYLKTLK